MIDILRQVAVRRGGGRIVRLAGLLTQAQVDYARNREKALAKSKKRIEENRDEHNAARRRHYAKNRKRMARLQREAYAANEGRRERAKERRRTKYHADIEAGRAANLAYREKNKDAINARRRAARAKLKGSKQ